MDKNKADNCNLTTHGAHTAVRKLRQGKIDNRTKHGRYLKTIKDKFLQDLGEEMNAGQEVILASILEEILFLRHIAEYAKEQGKRIIQKGKLIPALGENYISYTNCLARNIRLLYELKGKGKDSEQEGYLRAVMGKV